MNTPIRLLILAVILALSACNTVPAKDGVIRYSDEGTAQGDYLVETGVQKAQTKLAEAAVSTSDSLSQLAAMEKATAPRNKLSRPLNADRIGLAGLASVDWTGPVEPLVLRLAKAANYKFRSVGKNPTVPVIVAVNVGNLPIADILRDANLQAGKKADIVVYPEHRLIELHYR